MKAKSIFTSLKLSPSHINFGENIYAGNTSDKERCFLFEYHHDQVVVVSFIIYPTSKKVFCHFSDAIAEQTILSLIRGNITKFCLQAQGHFCLHASAICINDQVILFMGSKGAGKSTLATYFHLRGHAIWCDDYAMLQQENEAFFVSQGETSLKINPDIASTLNIPEEQLERVFKWPADWDTTAASDFITQKYYFNQQQSAVDVCPRKVAAIFFINPRVSQPATLITGTNSATALSVIMDEILLPGINSREYLKIYFQSAMNLLEIVPTYNIYPPDNIARIHEVYDSILETISTTRHEPSR